MRISVDNGMHFVSPEEALGEVTLDQLALYMDSEAREKVIRDYNCETDEDFLKHYLGLANSDLIFG